MGCLGGGTVIVDYGIGNLGSVRSMFKYLGREAQISADPKVISDADRLILSGVGSFDTGMAHLNASGLHNLLDERVLSFGVPVLGICLGMQLFTDRSEEGQLQGLGWIAGQTVRFSFTGLPRNLRIPHMGWNTVSFREGSSLGHGLDGNPRFYFAHSYHVVCSDEDDVMGYTHHGYDFASVITRGNVMGVQFHPEKSHRFGMQILRNFVDHAGC